MSSTLSTYQDQLSMIQGELYAERKNREETYDRIIKKLGNDILRVNEILNTEKKIKDENHSFMLKSLEEMKYNLNSYIQTEKKKAGEEFEVVLRLMEATTNSVEQHFNDRNRN